MKEGTQQPGNALSGQQITNVAIMWGIYAAFYLGRLNLSPALPAIAGSLKIGLGEVGILGNVFFWSYAAGQIINGQVGSLVRPHKVVLAGLLLVAAANIGFAMQTSLGMMVIFWGVNGFAQSMGWGPMLRILSSHIPGSQKRRISTLFSMSFQVGTSVAWGLAALLITIGDFRLAFIVPGVLLLGIALFWRLTGLDSEQRPLVRQQSSLSAVIADIRQLFPALLIAAFIGFVYIGFLIWLPTFIQSTDFLPNSINTILTALVPLVGIPGMLLAGRLLARQSSLFLTLTQVLLGLLICLLISSTTTALIQFIALLGAVMLASGIAALALSTVPMLLVTADRVSSAGGLITAIWSVAGGLAGTVVGSLAERSGWTAVFYLWIGCTLAAVVVALLAWIRTAKSRI
ncbi:MAG: MFS transporter [Anaerolineaceae bacterium]|nr:MFS transporter [Anaerolineaceae bacterium]